MDTRLRIPLDSSYAKSLGIAAYVFATLEWNAVWCCEHMRRGYANTLGRKTAGDIASDLVRFAGTTKIAEHEQLRNVSFEFQRLVHERNALLHAKPGAALDGSQRLFRKEEEWSPEEINRVADAFAECGMHLNALLHSVDWTAN